MNYFLLALKHKVFVFIEGLKLNVPLIQLILHDLSKFMPSEYRHYQRQFFGKADDPKGFIECWIHHQNHNKHHWEYWIPRSGHNRCTPPYPDNKPVEMPIKYAAEMIADWLAAGWAYNKKRVNANKWEWFDSNWDNIHKNLHPGTAIYVLHTINKLRSKQ